MGEQYPHMVDYCKPTNRGLPTDPQMVDVPAMSEEPAPYKSIGDRLARIRLGFSDLSQKAWAEKHGFPQTRYNNWETGARRIPVDDAERLCDLYGLTLDAIYRGRLDGLSENARKVF